MVLEVLQNDILVPLTCLQLIEFPYGKSHEHVHLAELLSIGTHEGRHHISQLEHRVTLCWSCCRLLSLPLRSLKSLPLSGLEWLLLMELTLSVLVLLPLGKATSRCCEARRLGGAVVAATLGEVGMLVPPLVISIVVGFEAPSIDNEVQLLLWGGGFPHGLTVFHQMVGAFAPVTLGH
ncbi:unnamed protein product [Linum trigynum]|uniref:Uncharacterized protein n=1 Tax=Linum trigynum TaxID=586398 RepID=A0AAV2E6J4_9ROSI